MKTMTACVLSACAFVAGCAGDGATGLPANPAVIIPYEGGLFTASAFARTEEGAFRKALGGAEMACRERQAVLAVVKTTTAFRGVVSREVQQSVSKIEEVISGSTSKTVPDLSSDEDYKVTAEFRCQRPGE